MSKLDASIAPAGQLGIQVARGRTAATGGLDRIIWPRADRWMNILEFLSTRNERLIHTKTDGIAGADTEPNVVTSWAIGELASLAGHKYKLRLVATDVLGRESVFREEQLPTCEIMHAPEV